MAELKTIKELAQELDCSYEAVRQHVKRYHRQLSDHISYIGKSQYLDEWACDFIKSKRVESPITVRTVERNERITELENENKLLLQQLAVVQNEMLKLKDEKHALELENAKIALLEADNKAQRVKIAEADQKAVQANSEAYRTKQYAAELEAYLKLPKLVQLFTKKPVLQNLEEPSVPNNGQWEIEVGDGYLIARCPGCHTSLREDEYTGMPMFSKCCPECGLALKVPENIPTFREVYGQSEEKE